MLRILLNSSSIVDSRAKLGGGAVWMSDRCGLELALSTLQLVNSSLINSTCTGPDLDYFNTALYGGAISARGGHLTLEGGSSIITSEFEETAARITFGGAIFVDVLARLVMAERSSIIHSVGGRGGAIFVEGGSAHVTDGSSIVNSSATDAGGAIAVAKGGKVRVEESSIVNASLRAGLALRGGVFELRDPWSELHLVSVTVRSNVVALGQVFQVRGFMLSISGNSELDAGNPPLFAATNTDFGQSDCLKLRTLGLNDDFNYGWLFHQMDAAKVLLRNVTFTPLNNCNATDLGVGLR